MPNEQVDKMGPKALDGGWGWMVVIGAHISIGFAYSVPKIMAIFYTYITEEMGADLNEVAWISSLMLAFMYGFGPVSSVLVSHYGSRPVVIMGGLMCGASMAAVSYGNTMALFYVFLGIIPGIGFAFNLNASLTIISKYFLVKRPLANGLAMAGSPVFLCALSPFIQFLVEQYGWRGALLILGGVLFNCCVAGSLMRPLPQTSKPSTSGTNTETGKQTSTDLKESFKASFKKTFNMALLKDRGLAIYLIGNSLGAFGAYSPFVLLPSFAISLGVDEYSASYLLSIMGFVDMVVRPTTGLIANTKYIRPGIQYFFSLALISNGVCHLLASLISTYSCLLVYTLFFGVTFGMVYSMIFECIMDLMGSERFPGAVGLVSIIECVPTLVGPPTAGLIVDVTGDYAYMFLMCGGVIASGGLFLLVMNFYNYRMLDKEKRQNAEENQNHIDMKQSPEKAKEQIGPEAKATSEAIMEKSAESPEKPDSSV